MYLYIWVYIRYYTLVKIRLHILIMHEIDIQFITSKIGQSLFMYRQYPKTKNREQEVKFQKAFQ